jgi:3-deoxy-7-phosphoheptulonate synthase
MIIVMKTTTTKKELAQVVAKVEGLGYQAHVLYGVERKVVACIGDERGKARLQSLETLPGVESVMPILKPYKLASHKPAQGRSVIRVRGGGRGKTVEIGGKPFVIMAGPCSVESEAQILATAKAVKKGGAQILRGGAYKPRTSPYAFQGMEEEGLKLLAKARKLTGLPVVTEVMNPSDVELVASYADEIGRASCRERV